MALRTRVWGIGKLVVLVGALGATFVIFAFIAMRVAVRARDVTVPSLVGQSLEQATASLASLDLSIRVDETRRPDATVPAGAVLAQDPPAGELARRMRNVRVWVSAGPRIVSVPRLVGESERSAQIRLVQEGMPEAIVAEIRSSDYPPDVVVAQLPAPGTTGSEVHLLVNRGQDRVSFVMPDLIGLPATQTADLLRNRGFRVSVVPHLQAAPGIPAGIILRQGPAGGYQVEPGDFITIEVSR
ncbi:MAG: PASTA domain-containing protein [Vicinamibacterales bacterium]|nr:PASTA domain-containing protein [Vicinamibacterales bacterium]